MIVQKDLMIAAQLKKILIEFCFLIENMSLQIFISQQHL